MSFAAPDLVVQSLSLDPSNKPARGRAIISFSVRNQGTESSAPCTLDVRMNTSDIDVLPNDPPLNVGLSIPSLISGSAHSFYFLFIVPADALPGPHFVWVHADVNNAAGQSDHDNDKAYIPFTVDAPSDADLIVWGPSVLPSISIETYPSTDCAVVEGCIQAGARKLLRFNAETRNLGPGDLILGNPVGNPLFYFSPCHGHYHMHGYLEYRLLDTKGVVAAGFKEGFCVLDTLRFDPEANPIGVYGCDYQGLQAGWGDVYSASLPCQWVDITNVPSGSYTLEMEVNPEHILPEADFGNNITRVPIEIPGPTPTPGPLPVDDAVLVQETIPSVVAPGLSIGIGIIFKNTGNTTWTTNGNYALAVLNDPCSLFSTNRIPLPSDVSVPPNAGNQFLAQIQIPQTEQACAVRLRMIEEPLTFGDELIASIQVLIPTNAAANWTAYE